MQSLLQAVKARRKILFFLDALPTLTDSDDLTRTKLRLAQSYITSLDYVFVHTPRNEPALRQLGVRNIEPAVWPHFPNIFFPAEGVLPTTDILFVGTRSPHRMELLKRLSRNFKVTGGSVFHSQSGPTYATAKIVLNIHYSPLGGFEARVSEVLGCRGFLLTERLDPDDVFIDGEHLAVIDQNNLVEQVESYLQDQELRQSIASRGYAKVQEYRVERLVERALTAFESLGA